VVAAKLAVIDEYMTITFRQAGERNINEEEFGLIILQAT